MNLSLVLAKKDVALVFATIQASSWVVPGASRLRFGGA